VNVLKCDIKAGVLVSFFLNLCQGTYMRWCVGVLSCFCAGEAPCVGLVCDVLMWEQKFCNLLYLVPRRRFADGIGDLKRENKEIL
jgi:hypothetical protein